MGITFFFTMFTPPIYFVGTYIFGLRINLGFVVVGSNNQCFFLRVLHFPPFMGDVRLSCRVRPYYRE
jgi:hypothetical protein